MTTTSSRCRPCIRRPGLLGVAFENFNTPDENQYLFVRSTDGGNTFQGPFFITPSSTSTSRARAHRPTAATAASSRAHRLHEQLLPRRTPGGNVVIDKRGGGAFADDFYLVMSDNRNGTARTVSTPTSSSSSRSTVARLGSGRPGSTTTASAAPANRDCRPLAASAAMPRRASSATTSGGHGSTSERDGDTEHRSSTIAGSTRTRSRSSGRGAGSDPEITSPGRGEHSAGSQLPPPQRARSASLLAPL